jgi:hypothetical protein
MLANGLRGSDVDARFSILLYFRSTIINFARLLLGPGSSIKLLVAAKEPLTTLVVY